MRRTGKRSSTSARRAFEQRTGPVGPGPSRIGTVAVLLAVALLLPAVEASALDFFTLWRQPQIPLQITEGAWADYATQVMSGGRREADIVRIACLDHAGGSDDRSWVFELLYLEEKDDGSLVPRPGEGTRLRIARDIVGRQGALLDHVLEIESWTAGVPETITPEQLQDDPLIANSLAAEFTPERVEIGAQTTRVIAGHQLLCDQFAMTAADTQIARLPAGEVIQVSTWEVVAAVNSEVPFLGLAFVSERVNSESRLDPESPHAAASGADPRREDGAGRLRRGGETAPDLTELTDGAPL